MTIPPESRAEVADAGEAAGSINPPSGEFEAIQRAPTGSDEPWLRRKLSELRQDCIKGWVLRGLMSEEDGARLWHSRGAAE